MPEHPSQAESASDKVQRTNPLASAVPKDSPAQSSAESAKANQPYPRWALIRDIIFAIGGFCAISILVWQAAHWLQGQVDKTVGEKLSDEKVLRQIAAQVKPSLIFDASEAIIEDMGAASFVADNGKAIHITKESDGWPKRINIDFTRHFANPPILTSMYEVTVIVPKRGKGFSWDFDVQDLLQHGAFVSTNLWFYRLELVP